MSTMYFNTGLIKKKTLKTGQNGGDKTNANHRVSEMALDL